MGKHSSCKWGIYMQGHLNLILIRIEIERLQLHTNHQLTQNKSIVPAGTASK